MNIFIIDLGKEKTSRHYPNGFIVSKLGSKSQDTVLNFPPKCDIESENDQNFVLNKKVNISKLEVYTKTIE